MQERETELHLGLRGFLALPNVLQVLCISGFATGTVIASGGGYRKRLFTLGGKSGTFGEGKKRGQAGGGCGK